MHFILLLSLSDDVIASFWFMDYSQHVKYGIVGRQAGMGDYKKYSPELKRSGIIWTRRTLKEYMHCPEKMVPGTTVRVSLSIECPVYFYHFDSFLHNLTLYCRVNRCFMAQLCPLKFKQMRWSLIWYVIDVYNRCPCGDEIWLYLEIPSNLCGHRWNYRNQYLRDLRNG